MGQFESFIGVNFWTALFVLLNTLAIFVVARKFLFVPVQKIIQTRQQEIDGMYADAGKAKADAQAMQTEYQQKLSEARATSERMVKEAVVRGQSRSEEIVRHASEEASAILTKAASDAAMEKKKAINDAKDEIAEMAMAIASKVVGRELNGSDQAALVDHFIDELGDEV
ncbi:MAG: F0F1 ATP synthase subunit B [Clostridia bacterium]|nr:F0F1 ATP synthase subunit B [Clostridia bacterium]